MLLQLHRLRAYTQAPLPCPPSPRLAAQLARTEEAAKRALIRSDTTAKGSTAQQLLDAQREVQTLRAENADLTSKLSRWAGTGTRWLRHTGGQQWCGCGGLCG